jgi:hypothetical protein
MGINLVLKIAVGVFLGMAAWTYRADIGTIFLYLIILIIGALIVFWIYKLITDPIKLKVKEKSIEKLVNELVSLNLLVPKTEVALTLGLLNAFSDDDFKSIFAILDDYKREQKNGESGEYYKIQLKKITDEVIEDFKQSPRD